VSGGPILHLLSQRPGRTGSGTTLDALARGAAEAGRAQHAVVAVPADEPACSVGALPDDTVHPLAFGTPALPFPVPGMSDLMPYESTRFSDLDDARWAVYRDAWRAHLARVAGEVRPALVHAHHLWVLSATARELLEDVPLCVHVHATGLRQRELCPERWSELAPSLARADAYLALHGHDAERVCAALDVPAERVHVVGAGYREELFHTEGRTAGRGEELLFAGKLADAKGLGPLLDAFERLSARRPRARLHLAGGGSGEESERLRARARELGERVILHGPLPPPALADLMRSVDVFVLPSLYEGLPLVLVEALASGCRLVATDLPGVRDPIAPAASGALHRVAPPPVDAASRARDEDLPAFAERLEAALDAALEDDSPVDPARAHAFRWGNVYARVQAIWYRLLGS
jgi:glycosyltransferase involved in cell wall biosynthesis